MATDANKRVHEVALVVDPAFGDKLVDLADRLHVWVIDTPANRTAAELARKGSREHSLERGITTFRADAARPPEEIVVASFSDIELHHGEYSHDPPWSVLEVYGTAVTEAISAALEKFGFAVAEAHEDGFRAVRVGVAG